MPSGLQKCSKYYGVRIEGEHCWLNWMNHVCMSLKRANGDGNSTNAQHAAAMDSEVQFHDGLLGQSSLSEIQ